MKATIDKEQLLEIIASMNEVNKETMVDLISSMPDAFEAERKEIITQYDVNQKLFFTRLSLVEQFKSSNADANTLEIMLQSANSFRDRADGIRDVMCILKM